MHVQALNVHVQVLNVHVHGVTSRPGAAGGDRTVVRRDAREGGRASAGSADRAVVIGHPRRGGVGLKSGGGPADRDVTLTRQVGRTVNNDMKITDSQRLALGLRVRKTHPTPQPPLTVRPTVAVTGAEQWTMKLAITAGTDRRRAEGAVAAQVFYAVADQWPSDPTGWTFAGNATKPDFPLQLPTGTPAGATVWVACAWVTRRGDTGPLSNPVSANIPGGGASTTVAKTTTEPKMKMVA